MIAKEYDEKIDYHRKDLKELAIRSGIISATAVLLVLLTGLESQSGLDMRIFAQEQNNNYSSYNPTTRLASNTSQALNSTQVSFASNIEQIRGHLNAAVMNKE